MSNFKKIVSGIAVLTAINVFSVGCFAMENNNKAEENKHKVEFLGKDYKKNNFFDEEQNENVFLGKKTKIEKQEEEGNVKYEKDIFKKPYSKNMNNIKLYKWEEEEVKNNKKEDENKNNSNNCLRFPNVCFPVEYVNNKNNSDNCLCFPDLYFPAKYLKNKNGEEFNSKDFDEDSKISSKYIMKDEKGDMILKGEFFEETTSKLLKEPFNFKFFKEGDVYGLGIEDKLKFIVDGYKKNILDYFLMQNFRLMYQKYIDNYLEKKGIKDEYRVGIQDGYAESNDVVNKLIKNYIIVRIPSYVLENSGEKELLTDLTKKAKLILESAAVQTKKDLENISDEDFGDVKKFVLQKRRHLEKRGEFCGYWDYIKKGLLRLKKEDLCYSYLDIPDNFVQNLCYKVVNWGDNGVITRKVNDYLRIKNENGLKIYEENKLEPGIQFEEFKKEDANKMFLENKDKRLKQYNLVRDEYKKLIFVDTLANNIEQIINDKYKFDIKGGHIFCRCEPVNSLVHSNELRKTRFNIFFPDYLDREGALNLSKDITAKLKKIFGEALIEIKKYFDSVFDFDDESNYEKILNQKRFKVYAEKKLNEEDLKSLTDELKEISGKDIMSILNYFKKFENFIDTIDFKYVTNSKINESKISRIAIGPTIYGEDLEKECWKGRGGELKDFVINFEPYDLEGELNKKDKTIFITKKMNKKIKK